jgi:hypothetical protein
MSLVFTTMLLDDAVGKLSKDQYREKKGLFSTASKATEDAQFASTAANASGSRKDHKIAAKAHDKAARAHRLFGNLEQMKAHRATAKVHRVIGKGALHSGSLGSRGLASHSLGSGGLHSNALH